MEKKRVLIFPAGAENAIEIYESLRFNVNVEVFGASGKKDFSEFLYDSEHYIEEDLYINKYDFIERINRIVRKYRIDVIIPTHDDVALFFAQKKKSVQCNILVADEKTATVCRKKKLTFELFKEYSFCPKIYEKSSEIKESDLPLFAKPDISQGAVGARKIISMNQLTTVCDDDVVCEYLPGKEYTIDCFTNRNGELTFVGARTRDRIVMGIAFRSSTLEATDKIRDIASVINKKLSFFGAWFFQLREDVDGNLKLMEISCRQAGTMTLYRHKGINFPMLGIFELFGVDTSFVLLPGTWIVERRLFSQFSNNITYDTIYIDYDDTLVINGKVNTIVIQFLYKCINEDKKIILLSRHDGDIISDMAKHRVFPKIFDDMIVMSFEEEKYKYINSKNAIFIDNSFAERKKVFEKLGIPVFDVDMVDSLL